MALTIRATIPMSMWIHKNAETKCIEVEHTYMIIYHTAEANIHSCKHSFNMFTTFINRKYDCRSKMDKITYLMKNSFCNQLRCCNVPPNHRPVCSLISQQHCHPRDGNDSPRNKGTIGLLVARNTQNTQPSQQSWVSQAIKELEMANC